MARNQGRLRKSKPSGSSLERWNTHDDIPDNEQDAFHRQQDMISLADADAGNGGGEEDEYGEWRRAACVERRPLTTPNAKVL